MTEAEKQAIVQNALKHQDGRQKLLGAGEEVIAELHERLRAEGWSEFEIQYMHTFMMSRRPLTNYNEIARKLIDVQPLPEGAQLVYYFDPVKDEE